MDLENIFDMNDDKGKPIIILDSGRGGLHVLDELSQKYPIENFIMFYDNEFSPYGTKNEKYLIRRISKIIKEIKLLNPKSIVIACNTLDAICGDMIESSFPNIQILHIIPDSAKIAVETTKNKKIAILGTKNTIESKKYMDYMLVKKNLQIFGVECLELATAIEEKENIEQTFKNEIKVLENIDFDTLVLGCTHYYYVKELITKKYPNVKIIDSSEILIGKFSQEVENLILNKASKAKRYIILTKKDEMLENLLKKKYNVVYKNL